MFKKTFIRLVVLVTLAFALCFVLVSTQKARESANSDTFESETKIENARPSSDFIMERLVGSVLFGIK